MTIALPRPVGIASRDELLVIEVTLETAPDEALAKLQACMPEGLTLLNAEYLPEGQKRVPCEALYEMNLGTSPDECLTQRVSEFLSTSNITINRPRHNRTGTVTSSKSVDVRQYVLKLELDGTTLRWTQSISQDGTVRMGEVLDALGLSAADYLHHVRRVSVVYRS
jgi:radical SAM-linked protein